MAFAFSLRPRTGTKKKKPVQPVQAVVDTVASHRFTKKSSISHLTWPQWMAMLARRQTGELSGERGREIAEMIWNCSEKRIEYRLEFESCGICNIHLPLLVLSSSLFSLQRLRIESERRRRRRIQKRQAGSENIK